MDKLKFNSKGPGGWYPPLPELDRKKIRFGACPLRAIQDQRLEKSHFKILIAISARDGMRKDRKGCFASQARLAEDTDLNPSTVSTGIKGLITWNYLGYCQHPKDARQNVYWVKYDYEVEEALNE